MTNSYRLAVVALHPIPYQVPIWSLLSKHPQIDLTVLFTGQASEKFPITTFDYPHKFLPNLRRKDSPWGKFSRINPTLIPEIARGRYDAVFIQGGYDVVSSWLALVGAKLGGVPAIFRGEASLYGVHAGWRQRLKSIVLPLFFRQFRLIMFTCGGNRAVYTHYGVPDSKLALFPCAVDNAHFRAEFARWRPQRAETRHKIGAKPDSFVVLYVARLESVKRHADLLGALRLLKEQGVQGIEAVLVGEGDQRPALEAYAAQHGLDNVHFLGFQPYSEIGKLCAAADMGVILSDYDPSPKALNEMLNFELPILCTETVGTAHDLVAHGESGYLVPVGDIPAIAEGIRKVAEDPVLAARMGKKSAEIVSAWSYEADVEALVKAVAQASRLRSRLAKENAHA